MTFRHRAGVSPYTSPFGFAETCVFAKQLLEPLLCDQLSLAPLIPKLRGHFAEFLNNTSPVGLWIFSSSTCVGLRYGCVNHYSGFSWQCGFGYFATFLRSLTLQPRLSGFTSLAAFVLRRVFPLPGYPILLRPHISESTQYRNFNLLSIDYVSRPHLRPRLTLSRSALPRKP